MASLYKKPVSVKDPKTGEYQKKKSKKWWGRYRDENGVEKRVPLATDKTAAQAMLNDLIKKVELAQAGVVDRFHEFRKRPVKEHLDEFERNLRARDTSEEHVKLVLHRAKRIVEGCKANRINDLTASHVQGFLAELRENGISIQTSNHYLRAIKQFTRWLVKDRRVPDDALAFIPMQNVSTDLRHDRRPLSNEEISRLLTVAKEGEIVLKMNGPDRAMLYAVAAYTGLRACELASLTVESFDLESDPALVTVNAAYSKRRREDELPLHPSLVAQLRPWLAKKDPRSPIWPGSWAKQKYAGKMLVFLTSTKTVYTRIFIL